MNGSITRSALLGASSAIALVGVDALRAFVEAAQAADPNDLATLNAAAELERAAIKAYQDAAATNLLTPGVLKVATGFMADHIAHRDALVAAVTAGGGVVSQATAKIEYPSLKSQGDILVFASVLEKKAAGTYASVIPDFRDKKLAEVAAHILSSESAHVGMLAMALQQDRAYPTAFPA